MIIRKAIVLCIITITCFTNGSFAKDFGKMGMTFEIKEEGFIAMIHRKLATINLQEEQRKMTDLAKTRVMTPQPVMGLKRADKVREFYYDPTYVLSEDIVLPCGKILHKAGASVNPLEHISFDRRLYFIDGRDKEQVEWLKKLLEANKKEAVVDPQPNNAIENRIILTGGKIFELQEELGRQLYFDQAGELTTKFGIEAVPAIAEQEKNRIKINELALGV